MKNNWMRTLLCLMAALVLSLGCALGETAETNEAPAAEASAEATEAPAAEPVLWVTVNGTEIHDQDSDVKQLVDYYISYYSQYGYDTSDPSMLALLQEMGMEWAIENALYRQKAAELGISGPSAEEEEKTRTEAKAQWDLNVDDIAAQMGSLTGDATEEEKAAARVNALAYIESVYGYTEESYIAEAVEQAKLIKIREDVQKAVMGEVTVSEDEIIKAFNDMVDSDKEMYEGNAFMYEYYTNYGGQSSCYIPSGYRGILHILLNVDENLMKTYTDLAARFEEQQQAAAEETTAADAEATAAPDAEATEAPEAEATAEPTATPEPVTKEQVDAARQAILDSVQAKVDEIKTKFEAGTPFVDLIAEYGTDPGMKDATNLANGYAVHKDSILWDPAFTAGAMALEKVGDISEPVLGSGGVHILYYLRDIPAGAVDMTEEIRSNIEKNLLTSKTAEQASAMVQQWIAESDIKYTEAGQALVDAMAAMQAEAAAAAEDTEAPAEEATEAPAEEATEAPAQ